jgi:hypothetical protein
MGKVFYKDKRKYNHGGKFYHRKSSVNFSNGGKSDQHRYGTGDESHLIIYDPNRIGGHGIFEGLNERAQTLFNTGKFGYNLEKGTLVKLKDPSVYDIDYGDGRYFSMVPTTDKEKNQRKEKKIWKTKSESTSEEFDVKKYLEDFYGVTEVKQLLKSNTVGELLSNITNTRVGGFGKFEFNPANWGRKSITGSTREEAFANAEASGNVNYGDQFIWEKDDGTRERMFYEHAGKPLDEETLRVLARIEEALTPAEYQNFLKRYASYNNPHFRIGVKDKGTQFVNHPLGRSKSTIYIATKDQKSIDNLIESIYSEFAHAEQLKKRGTASDRKGEIEYHAHSGGEEDTGIEGKLLTEDFYETRGDYDHDKESFATPIDTRYFATQAAKRATEKLISQRTEQKKEVVQNVTDQQPSGLWSKIFNIADKADKQ